GYAYLNVHAGFTNHGTIIANSNNFYYATFNAGDDHNGDFNNANLLYFQRDNDAPLIRAQVNGNLVNNGTIVMNSDVDLNGTASNDGTFNIGNNSTLWMSRYRFNQDTGSLGTSGATHFIIHNGGFNFFGGNIYLTVDLYNSWLTTSIPNGGGTAFNCY